MRVLADLAKDTDGVMDLAIVEILAAQVIAAAAYHGRPLGSEAQVTAAVQAVAGYPMLNRPDGPGTPTIDQLTVARVREILEHSAS